MITTLKGLDVIDNPFYGIEGGWKLDLTAILLQGVPAKFAEQIPPGVAPPPAGRSMIEGGYFTNEEFAEVPNIFSAGRDAQLQFVIPVLNITINQTIPGFGFDLPPKAARMSHILASWVVDRAWDGLVGIDGEMKFEGFSALFGQETEEESRSSSKRSKQGKVTKITKVTKVSKGASGSKSGKSNSTDSTEKKSSKSFSSQSKSTKSKAESKSSTAEVASMEETNESDRSSEESVEVSSDKSSSNSSKSYKSTKRRRFLRL